LRIRHDGASTPRALVEWLARRPEVIDLRDRPERGLIDVRYRELGPSGAFVRTLRDRLFAMRRRPRPELRIMIAHAIPGRARFQLDGGSEEQLCRMAEWLAQRPGVLRASASPAAQSAVVQYEPSVTSADALLRQAAASDPATWPKAPGRPRSSAWPMALLNTAVLGAVSMEVGPPAVLGAAVALTAVPAARRTLAALRRGRLSVDLLDVGAIGISIATGQPATGALITWLLGLGDFILERTADRARSAVSVLMELDTTEAYRLRDGRVQRVRGDALSIGDRIIVVAGQRVAADGVVASGAATVDEKALTGESSPRTRQAGDRVLAATTVLEGQVVVEVQRSGGDTTASAIVRVLEGAGAKPMTLQREAERVADHLVLPTLGVAGASALLASQVERMTSVLITDFGTGIRIAVPTSALCATTIAARQGVLLKGGQYLERLSKVDAVVFDKTGTLTSGEPRVVEISQVGRMRLEEVLALAAGAESRQRHPIASAIRQHAEARGIVVPEPELGTQLHAVGMGVAARVLGHDVLVGGERWIQRRGVHLARGRGPIARQRMGGVSSVFVAIDGKAEAVVGCADEPRAESRAVVRALAADGRREVILLSGDARGRVEAVGRAVGASRALGDLLPDDKVDHVRALQRSGRIVAMVGDGINDAPALAVADVGISLHGSTDVAVEAADVVLLEGGLSKLPDAFSIADRAMSHVRRGIAIVIVPNAVAIALGALGLLSPGLAAVVNNGSTVVAALAAVAPMLGSRSRRRATSPCGS
jgi:Cu2+-exporting ATPase